MGTASCSCTVARPAVTKAATNASADVLAFPDAGVAATAEAMVPLCCPSASMILMSASTTACVAVQALCIAADGGSMKMLAASARSDSVASHGSSASLRIFSIAPADMTAPSQPCLS